MRGTPFTGTVGMHQFYGPQLTQLRCNSIAEDAEVRCTVNQIPIDTIFANNATTSFACIVHCTFDESSNCYFYLVEMCYHWHSSVHRKKFNFFSKPDGYCVLFSYFRYENSYIYLQWFYDFFCVFPLSSITYDNAENGNF